MSTIMNRFMLSPPLSKRKTKSAEDIKIVIDFVGDRDERDETGSYELMASTSSTPLKSFPSPLSKQRKSLQENGSFLKTGHNGADGAPRRKSFDVASDSDRRPSVFGTLISRINLPAMKKTDTKGSGSSKGSSSSTTKPNAPKASPLVTKKSFPLDATSSQSQQTTSSSGQPHTAMTNMGLGQDDGTLTGTSSEDLVLDNGSDTGTDEVDGENSARTRQVIETLQAKIQKTKEAIKKEQNNKESIVNEYLQMATDKQPTARIKALFEKKNQKSGQNIVQLQRKLETYQHRLTEVETHGYTGHKQAKEVLRDVGQGLNTIVSKPKEIAHLIKNKFGSADNIAQLSKFYVELEDPNNTEGDGKTGGTLPASFKYNSDDENSSITSGSGLGGAHSSPHSTGILPHGTETLSSAFIEPITQEIREVKDSAHRISEVLHRLTDEFEEYKTSTQSEFRLLRNQLEDERYKVERLEEQLNDLTELHQHEMLNLKQDMSSMEEKIEYRLDERTTDLSDLVDTASTRISRLEQQQQQQQILSMEMVENATFRTIISKLINVVLALLAVVLVFVSTAANFLSPFVHSTSRLLISLVLAVLAWLFYHNYHHIQAATSSILSFFTSPWS